MISPFRNQLILAIALLALGTAPVAEAGFCRTFLLSTSQLFTQSLSGKKVALDGTGGTIEVGEKLGNGLGGAAYRVTAFENIQGAQGISPRALVVKFPLVFRRAFGGAVMPHSRTLQEQELDIAELVSSRISQIEASPLFPAGPYWKSGHFPAAAVIARIETRYGPAILKPLLRGQGLLSLLREHGTRLPPEMKASLRQMFQLFQAMRDTVPMNGKHMFDQSGKDHGRRFSLDINPSNLVWIEDPAQLESLGLNRPGFVLFEIGEIPGDPYAEEKMSFEEFLVRIATANESETDLTRLGD